MQKIKYNIITWSMLSIKTINIFYFNIIFNSFQLTFKIFYEGTGTSP